MNTLAWLSGYGAVDVLLFILVLLVVVFLILKIAGKL
jgi:hypothetical protein